MGKVCDHTGQRFNRLLVLSRAKENSRGRKARWNCLCDCGKQVIATGRELRCGDTGSCGCLRIDRITKAPIALRFWDRVDVCSPGECWEWQGPPDPDGRGSVYVAGRLRMSHRVAWSLHHGREPEQCILHHCDNRLCCNPAHLYEGTKADNTRDMLSAGRNRNGWTGPMTFEENLATKGHRRCTD